MKTIIKYSAIAFIFTQSLFPQWSTSPFTKDALFACPGFYSDLITYPDGSSIIIGIGDNNEIWMQKLDPYGYKQWLPWISVFPSMAGQRTFLPDDDGGIYAIIGTQAQRVDKNGNLCWGANGKTIIPTGSITKAVTDGKNGFIALYNHFDSLQRITVFRYDSTGAKLWDRQIDSSKVQSSITGDIIGRLKQKMLIYSSKSGYKFMDINSNVIVDADTMQKYINNFSDVISFVTDDTIGIGIVDVSQQYDSLGRKITTYRITKFSQLFKIEWSTIVDVHHLLGSYAYVMPPMAYDRVGGVFLFGALFDSTNMPYTQIHRVTSNGMAWGEDGVVIINEWGTFPFVAKGEIGFVFPLNGKVQKFDTSGALKWGDSLFVIRDIDNTYFNRVKSDNNGGAIMSFWIVAGGIWVQHTGRGGKVGVITSVHPYSNNSIPSGFYISQNFPNPFNPATTISYSIPDPNNTKLIIYDYLGREVKVVVDEFKEEGKYNYSFDAHTLSSGVYFYTLISGKHSETKRMLLIK